MELARVENRKVDEKLEGNLQLTDRENNALDRTFEDLSCRHARYNIMTHFAAPLSSIFRPLVRKRDNFGGCREPCIYSSSSESDDLRQSLLERRREYASTRQTHVRVHPTR